MRVKFRGVVRILDNRILTKRYGKAFLNALPEAGGGDRLGTRLRRVGEIEALRFISIFAIDRKPIFHG